jgi:choline dehydrogenase-like flavoprotein
MFIDANTLSQSAVREHDICIVGAGAAGISLAREFLGAGRDVCLLESGGLDLEEAGRDLCRGEVDDAVLTGEYLSTSRLRVFGGSMMAWGGLCRPLDEIDFEPKPWLPDYPGWPFSRGELVPYYRRAAPVVETESFFGSEPEREGFIHPGVRLVALPFNFSPPTFMGAFYRADFEAAGNTTVYLHANARELVPTPGGNHIARLRVVTAARNEITVRARVYVLCAGGIEIPRILLNSDSVVPAGVGNDHDLVGRFFMSHYPIQGFGKVLFVVKDLAGVERTLFRRTLRYLCLSDEVRREHRLLAAGFLFHPQGEYGFVGRNPGSMERVLPAFESLLRGGDLWTRAFPILAVPEQAPNRESRVLLTADKDATGMRRVRLQFRRSPVDLESFRTTVELLAREFGRNSLGRLQTMFAGETDPTLRPDQHHMGTTRMHRDPRQGVVDPDGKVHGVDNLYVAGPSVYPSGGFANPVLTIIALALRLADHLKAKAA